MGGYVLVVVVAWTQDAPNDKVFCEAWKGKGFHAIDRRGLKSCRLDTIPVPMVHKDCMKFQKELVVGGHCYMNQ